jgi:hypothetical protein
MLLHACCVGLLALGVQAEVQSEQISAVPTPVTVEYYYRIKWGGAGEFLRLYRKNHAPLLEEMKKRGFIRGIRVDEPFTHLAGGPRWDLRVTIVFRDASAAMPDPEWDKQWASAMAQLYSDRDLFEAEEKVRFGLLEEHWDVVISEVSR